jgi:predicted nuclease of restriction endonuclease-like (RecB) superfamily
MKLKTSDNERLIENLTALIEEAKQNVVSYANSSVSILFWHIGKQILGHTLLNQRAEYGKQIVVSVSRQLVQRYGTNYEEKNLRRMIQFVEKFSDFEIVVTLSRQLSWSHFIVLIPLKNSTEREFYANQAINNNWGVRELRKQIERKIFERTEHANLQLTNTQSITKNIFKDPYLLDFLELKTGFLENDLETSILRELEHFILELGNGFSFVERQKRMIIDGEDFYLDLLFYHRKLKRLVAIELKIDKFKAKYKGQMELYLGWLDKYEKQEGEESPIGLILCAEASKEQIELLQMHKDGIMVAEYWTELLPKEMLESKLHKYLQEARERIERKKIGNADTKIND